MPDATTFRAILDQLDDYELAYVHERSKVRTDADGYRNAGIGKATFYTWPKEKRNHLNELAQQLKRERLIRIQMVIDDAAESAAEVKVEGLKSKKEYIRQAVATEILNRTVGSPAERHEVTGREGGPIETTDMSDNERIARIVELLYEARDSASGDA